MPAVRCQAWLNPGGSLLCRRLGRRPVHGPEEPPPRHRSSGLLRPCRVAEPDAAPQPHGEDDDGAETDDDAAELSYVDRLNVEFGVPNMILFTEGEGGLPRVWLKHLDSCMGAELYLHGATLTQWLRPDGSAALDSHPVLLPLDPDGDTSNKGAGLRLAFPLFRAGTAMTLDDGFAGRLPWEVVAAGLTCMPCMDGLEGDAFQPKLDAYLKQQEEEPDLLGPFSDDELETCDPLVESSIVIPRRDDDGGDGEAGVDAAGDEGGEQQQLPQQEQLPEEPVLAVEEDGGATVDEATAPSAKRGRKKATPPGAEAPEAEKGPADKGAPEREADTFVGRAAELEQAARELDEAIGRDMEYYSPAMRDLLARLEAGYDPAPFITLRLADSEATRAIWPHRFEVLYKITVMETDDKPSTDVNQGGDALGASDTVAAIAADDMQNEGLRVAAAPEPVRPPAGRPDPVTGTEVPVQLKLNIIVINRDPQDAPQPMQFELGALMQFAVADVVGNRNEVKVLGLGASTAIDYTHDRRFGALMGMEEDYLHYQGHPLDATFVRVMRSDIKLAPGDGTHYELLARKGFNDACVFHPGVPPTVGGGYDPWRNLAGFGVGRLAAPATLQPEEFFEAELVLRWHNHAWLTPSFGDGTPFVPDLDPQDIRTPDETGGNVFSELEDDVGGGEGDNGGAGGSGSD